MRWLSIASLVLLIALCSLALWFTDVTIPTSDGTGIDGTGIDGIGTDAPVSDSAGQASSSSSPSFKDSQSPNPSESTAPRESPPPADEDHGPLHGHVRDSKGRGLPSVELRLLAYSRQSAQGGQATYTDLAPPSAIDDLCWTGITDEDGAFQSTPQPRGLYAIIVKAEGLPFHRRDEIAHDPTRDRPIDILVVTSASVTGYVFDGEGNPLGGVQVIADGPPGEAHTTSDTKGAFRFEDLALAHYQFRVTGENVPFASAWRQVTADMPPVFLRASATVPSTPFTGSSLRGTVFDETTGKAPFSFEVAYGTSPKTRKTRKFRSSDGTFVLEGLSPGIYDLHVEGGLGAPFYQTGIVIDGSRDVELDVRLTKGGTVEGRVVDADRVPIAGAFVYRLNPVVTDASVQARQAHWVKSDRDGRWKLDRLPGGLNSIRLSKKGYGSATAENVVVREGGVSQAGTTVLLSASSLSGRVYRADGSPLTWGTVVLTTVNPTLQRTYSVDVSPQGDYTLSDLDAGTYELDVWVLSDSNPQEKKILSQGRMRIRQSTEQRHDIVLAPTTSETDNKGDG